MPIIIQAVIPEFPAYEKIWQLRDDILRKPLGLRLTKEDILKEGAQIHLVAFSDDAVVGCVLLAPLKDEMKLRQMAVAEALRGQGIGRQLLFAAESLARQRGYKIVSCHARETAVKFYEANGWIVEGDRFIEVTIPHFAMRKSL